MKKPLATGNNAIPGKVVFIVERILPRCTDKHYLTQFILASLCFSLKIYYSKFSKISKTGLPAKNAKSSIL